MLVRLFVVVLFVAGCSKSDKSTVVENGVRVNYVDSGARCNHEGICVPGSGSQQSYACAHAVTKTAGNDGEIACYATLTLCRDVMSAMRDAIANKEPDAAEFVSVGECEIYRVRN